MLALIKVLWRFNCMMISFCSLIPGSTMQHRCSASFLPSFILSCFLSFHSFIHSFISFNHSFLPSFLPSFNHSIIRSAEKSGAHNRASPRACEQIPRGLHPSTKSDLIRKVMDVMEGAQHTTKTFILGWLSSMSKNPTIVSFRRDLPEPAQASSRKQSCLS